MLDIGKAANNMANKYFVIHSGGLKDDYLKGYISAPYYGKDGRRVPYWDTLTDIKPGDLLFHYSRPFIRAISIATTSCHDVDLSEIPGQSSIWGNTRRRVKYKPYVLEEPIRVSDYKDEILKYKKAKNSAFNKNGGIVQGYVHELEPELALLFENAAGIDLPVSEYDRSDEYDQVEMESIDHLVQLEQDDHVPEWLGKKEKQDLTTSKQTGRAIPKRDPQHAADALKRAHHLCEYDSTDRTFLRKNGKPYTEPHHLIPISRYKDFDYSVDVMENIVSLCSHCHNLLHYGRLQDKLPILEKLYNDRKEALSSCGLDITLDDLKEYYK